MANKPEGLLKTKKHINTFVLIPDVIPKDFRQFRASCYAIRSKAMQGQLQPGHITCSKNFKRPIFRHISNSSHVAGAAVIPL